MLDGRQAGGGVTLLAQAAASLGESDYTKQETTALIDGTGPAAAHDAPRAP